MEAVQPAQPLPSATGAETAPLSLLENAANAEGTRRAVLPQRLHSAGSLDRLIERISSNLSPQSPHLYSYSGTALSLNWIVAPAVAESQSIAATCSCL